jgi:hypothetical protein
MPNDYYTDLITELSRRNMKYDVVETYADRDSRMEALVSKRLPSMLLCSPAGKGKSYDIEPEGGKYREETLYFGAKATHYNSILQIKEAVEDTPRKEHPLLAFNDVQGIFKTAGMIGLLQQALCDDPDRARVYTYGAGDAALRIVGYSPAIVIANDVPRNMTETLLSLVSRAGSMTIFMPTVREMHKFAGRWFGKTPKERRIYDFIGENVEKGVIKRHDLRDYRTLLNRTAYDPKWREWALHQWLGMLPLSVGSNGKRADNHRDKLRICAELLRQNLKWIQRPRRYKRVEFCPAFLDRCKAEGLYGGSQADAYRVWDDYVAMIKKY